MTSILSVHRWLDSHALWQQHTTSVRTYCPEFYEYPRTRQLFELARLLSKYDICVLYYDHRLAFAAAVYRNLLRVNTKLVLVEFYPFVGRTDTWQPRASLRRLYYATLLHILDKVIVHSSAEAALYHESFGVASNRVGFIPYFSYFSNRPEEALDNWQERWRTGYILCPGRHRDLETFLKACAKIDRECIIVTGRDDVLPNQSAIPPNVHIRLEVSVDDYYGLFTSASVVVLPFSADHGIRSYGHIAFLTAASMQVPVVTSQTFHLQDYARDGVDCLQYEPGDESDLADKTYLLLRNDGLARTIALNAYRRVNRCFTRERYVRGLLGQIYTLKSNTRKT